MNGVDYSKALARERDHYQNSIQKDRANNEKRLEDEQERHAKIQKKQFDRFEKDRGQLESDYKTNISNIENKTQESLQEQRERFHKSNAAEQDRFHAEREATRKDFDTRFRDIKDSYARSKESADNYHRTVEGEQQARYNDNVERLTQDKDKKIADFQNRMIGSGADLKAQYAQEKNQMVRAHEKHLEGVYKEEGNKRFMLKEGLAKDLERTKQAYDAEKEQTQTYHRDKMSNAADNFNARSEKLADDYAKRNTEFVDSTARENFTRNKQHQHELAETRRNYEKGLRNIEIDRRRRDNGSGEFNEVVQRQQGLKNDQAYEDRISKMKTNLTAAQREYNNRLSDESEKYKEAVHAQTVDAATRLERKERELTASKIVEVTNEREKAQKLHNTQTGAQIAERQHHQGQLVSERQEANKQIKELKENFNKSLGDLQERNEKFAEELRKSNNEERAKFVTDTNIKRNEEILELRRNFNKLMDTTTTDYESRLAAASRENAQLKNELDQKVGFVMSEADREMKLQAQKYNDKAVADQKAAQQLMDTRETNFRNKILEVSDNFQRKMDRQTYNYEMQMKNTVNEYEAKLKQQDATNLKAMSEKDTLHGNEMKRLKMALEQEKAQIISQYENQINQLKLSQKQQMDQLNDYKRMG